MNRKERKSQELKIEKLELRHPFRAAKISRNPIQWGINISNEGGQKKRSSAASTIPMIRAPYNRRDPENLGEEDWK